MIYWTRDPVVVRIKSISFIWSSLACRFVYFNDSNQNDPTRSAKAFGSLRFWVSFFSFGSVSFFVLIAQFVENSFFPHRHSRHFSLFLLGLVWRHFHVCWRSTPKINSKLLFFRLPVISRCHLYTHACVCVCFYRYTIGSTYVLHAFFILCICFSYTHTSYWLPTRYALNLFALQTYFLHLLWQIIKTHSMCLYFSIVLPIWFDFVIGKLGE